MNNNPALEERIKLFETIITVETLNVKNIESARELFESYKKKRIIIDCTFEDERWQFCDEYSNVGIIFKIQDFTYKRYYKSIFGISTPLFIKFLKTYLILTMGTRVLESLRNIVNDIKKLIKYDYRNILNEDIKFTKPNNLIEFIELMPCIDDNKKKDLLDCIDLYEEMKIEEYLDRKRDLAEFDSYFKFNEIILDYWNLELTEKGKLFYFPVYLWWKLTAVIPLRPREFILTPRECLSISEGKHYISLRRNRLKGSEGNVHYNIEQDYVIVKYHIPIKLATDLRNYINLTNSFEDNETNTLFRTEPHYAMFGQKKKENSRFYTYINLSCCLHMFFQNIIEEKLGMNVIKRDNTISINLREKDIEFIYLGDTRHIAMINIIAEGGTPTIAMQLAGHTDIKMSSHYYSNITKMIECRTYAKYKKILSGKEDLIIGSNFYPLVIEDNYIEIENGARCYSTKFAEGDYSDCRNASGDSAEIGYCYNCTYYRKDGLAYFVEDDNFYKSSIEQDCNYLKTMIEKVRKGLGYNEEIKEALLKLQNSSSNYEKYCLQKLIKNQSKEENKNGS